MKNYLYSPRLRRQMCAALAALSLVSVLEPAAGAVDLELGAAPSTAGITANVSETTTALSMAVRMERGLWWIGCYRDVYQALNLQFDQVGQGLVLDGMNFQLNEIWILTPVSGTSVYFSLAPLSHPGYYIAGQSNDCQLKLSKTSTSDPAVQWMAIPDGSQYVLVNRKTGLAMDTAHGESATGNPVLNYQRNGYRDAQSWNMIRVSESTSTFTPGPRAYPKNGAYGILAASNPAKGANNQFGSTAGDGTACLVLDTWNREPWEIYNLTDRGGGQYTISPSNAPNVCLNCWAANPNDGNQLTLATWREGDQCSLWEVYQSGSFYSFRNVKTGLWLNLWMNRTVDGTKLVGYHYDGTNAMKWKLEPVSVTPPTPTLSGYAAYTGVNYRSLTSDSRRIAACDKAVQMATVQWTAPCDFPTWKSSGGVYNTTTATDGTASRKFLAGKTYTGIPYSMAGRTYDDMRWLQQLRSGITTKSMTTNYTVQSNGKKVTRTNTTAKGIDCSYLVCTALNTGCGTSTSKNTDQMLSSSLFKQISRSEMLPGDIFLKSGHTMLFLGKVGSSYAVIEANADKSRVVYSVLSSSSLRAYKSYRYTYF
ncbi:RICIN domain-containing protein [Dysosmobacter sp.]|uniref:RICIN domain-containing protein n=1 Tax=Dysosmobacter sp. TaxID=2591382 RepID=UPI002A8531F2|nr:hypothetical protein [Dysosmobacter sp.]MDY3281214.1 hypothetical protein [Dysosmobacter sp.]